MDEDRQVLIVDGPPGIGCPVIAASAGADLALLVVEPTLSGIHDLERILATVSHFRVPALVCINKADLSEKHSASIRAFCVERGIEIVGMVPYDTVVTEAMVQGQPVTCYQPQGSVAQALESAWKRIATYLEQ
jgi:MinD superfamily P-loop ATPase